MAGRRGREVHTIVIIRTVEDAKSLRVGFIGFAIAIMQTVESVKSLRGVIMIRRDAEDVVPYKSNEFNTILFIQSLRPC